MTDFFEKVTDGVDKGIRKISSKSREFLETTRLKGEVKDTEAAIQNKFQALGKKVFEMLNRGALNEEELKADCTAVSALFKKITELEEAIKRIELEALKTQYGTDMVVCPKCNSTNKSDAKFCMSCGSAMVGEIKTEGNVCSACGASVKEGAKFCMRCGGKIE